MMLLMLLVFGVLGLSLFTDFAEGSSRTEEATSTDRDEEEIGGQYDL
ncbi:MAG: hypothetical protein ACKO37_09185 [Vampirovibrionales bacterium]